MRIHAVAGLLVTMTLCVAGCSSEPTQSGSSPEASERPASPSVSTDPSAPAADDDEQATTPDAVQTAGTPSPTTPSGSPSTEPSPSATPGAEGPALEMPPEDGGSTPTEQPLSELIETPSDRPLVSKPLPRSASAQGRLVAGFPIALRPVGTASIVSSSVSAADPRLQVALVATTSRRPAAVLRAYRARLTGRGMREGTAPATVGGAEAAAFTRGQSNLTVTVRRDGSTTTYEIYGVLHAGRE